jgi:hypothetical protein
VRYFRALILECGTNVERGVMLVQRQRNGGPTICRPARSATNHAFQLQFANAQPP